MRPEGITISKSRSFNDCVVLDKEVFDPDAVFLDDIVDDEMLPTLSLAVDGLTTAVDGADGRLDMPSNDAAVQPRMQPSSTMPAATLNPEQLEVYGWESSLWRKIRGYLGF